jgi:hypothetical protein
MGAGIGSAVSRVAWCEGAKPEGGKQVLFNFLHHLSGPIPATCYEAG